MLTRHTLCYKTFPILYIFLMCIICACSNANNDKNEYSYLRNRLDEAIRLQFDADSTNQAMMIYSEVADSYRLDMPLEVKQLVVEALNRMWYVYYFELFDYADATECLETGFDICESDNIDASRVYLNKGITFSLLIIRQKNPSDKIFKLADVNLREAHRQSVLSKNINVADYALLNLIVLYDKMECPVASLDSMLKETISMHGNESDSGFSFGETLFIIVKCFQKKKYKTIVETIDNYLATNDFPADEIRNKYQLLLYKARAMNENGQQAETVTLLDCIKEDADSLGLADVLMPTYELKAQAYANMNLPFDASLQMLAYYEQRDALLSEETLMSINELPLIHDINKSRRKLLKEKYERYIVTIYALVVSISLLLLSILVIIIMRKNKKLKNANLILFQRNEEQLIAFEARFNKTPSISVSDKNENETSQATVVSDGMGVDEDSELRIIYDKAVRTIEDNRLWTDSSLTIAQLAVKLNVGEKALSKAIHMFCSLNFTSFINRYRIMEASMMLGNNKDYGHLSIQGIAETVGFKSRTTFIASFKQFVGMLPSAYRKIAMDNKE